MKKVLSADLVDESINDHFKELLSDFLSGNVSVRGVLVHPDFRSFVGKSLGGKLGEDSALGLVWSMLVLDRIGFSYLCRFLEKKTGMSLSGKNVFYTLVAASRAFLLISLSCHSAAWPASGVSLIIIENYFFISNLLVLPFLFFLVVVKSLLVLRYLSVLLALVL